MSLTVSPFEAVYQGVYEALLAAMPDTTFLLKAPIIVPYSDMKAHPFTITANPGDRVDLYVNDSLVQSLIAPDARFQVDIFLNQGYNFIRAQTALESFKMVIAATNYATLYSAWADQYFAEVGVKLQDMALQLNSRWSLKQVEHQIMWQDLLPGTRSMRILAGKMAVKSLISGAPTDVGIEDLAKAVTGNTPVIVPTQLDLTIYEPECRLLYAQAQDFGGYEFDIWLFNLCAASWQAFIVLLNNLDDTIYKLKAVSDQRVLVDHAGQLESHVFQLDANSCSIQDLMTRFLDCFSRIKVFVAPAVLDEFSICAYGYPFDLAVEFPLGYIRFDSGILLDNNPQIPFDSSEEADPYPDGWLGVPISCRFDGGNGLDSLAPQVLVGATCQQADGRSCGFQEPCAAGLVTALTTIEMRATNAGALFFWGGGTGLPNIFVTQPASANVLRLAPLTYTTNGTIGTGANNRAIAFLSGKLYVASGATNIVVLDPQTVSVITTLNIGAQAQRIEARDSRYLYTANTNGSVTEIDTLTDTTSTVVSGLNALEAIRFYGPVMYCVATAGRLYARDATTFAPLWNTNYAVGARDVLERDGSLWLVDATGGQIIQIDPVTRLVVATIPGPPGADRLLYVPVQNQWYVHSSTDNNIWALDTLTATAAITYTLTAAHFPRSSWVAGGSVVYLACTNGKLVVLDTAGPTITNFPVAVGLYDVVGV